MIKLIVAIRDLKAKSFTNPVATENINTALRDFSTIVKDGRTLIGQHPEDFELYQLGEFDVLTGEIFPTSPLLKLGSALDFFPKTEKE